MRLLASDRITVQLIKSINSDPKFVQGRRLLHVLGDPRDACDGLRSCLSMRALEMQGACALSVSVEPIGALKPSSPWCWITLRERYLFFFSAVTVNILN